MRPSSCLRMQVGTGVGSMGVCVHRARARTAGGAPMSPLLRTSWFLTGATPSHTADLELAAAGVVASALRNAGQTCVCANRVFVHEAVHDKLAGMCVSVYMCACACACACARACACVCVFVQTCVCAAQHIMLQALDHLLPDAVLGQLRLLVGTPHARDDVPHMIVVQMAYCLAHGSTHAAVEFAWVTQHGRRAALAAQAAVRIEQAQQHTATTLRSSAARMLWPLCSAARVVPVYCCTRSSTCADAAPGKQRS